jgi:hypothetical protein
MENLLLYVFDILVIGIVAGLLNNSSKVKMRTDMGSGKIIALIFSVVSLFMMIKERSSFFFYQGALILLIGVAYLFIKSGFADEGIVIMGKLYKRNFIEELRLEIENEVLKVTFKYKHSYKVLLIQEKDRNDVAREVAKLK